MATLGNPGFWALAGIGAAYGLVLFGLVLGLVKLAGFIIGKARSRREVGLEHIEMELVGPLGRGKASRLPASPRVALPRRVEPSIPSPPAGEVGPKGRKGGR